jgi:hypothetical protein
MAAVMVIDAPLPTGMSGRQGARLSNGLAHRFRAVAINQSPISVSQ